MANGGWRSLAAGGFLGVCRLVGNDAAKLDAAKSSTCKWGSFQLAGSLTGFCARKKIIAVPSQDFDPVKARADRLASGERWWHACNATQNDFRH